MNIGRMGLPREEPASDMPRFTTLYSGSSGNAGVAEQDGKYVLIDMGSSCRATMRGLQSLELELEGLAGILVTHEHSDHIKGLLVFLKRHPVPLYGSSATLNMLRQMDAIPSHTELVEVNDRREELPYGFSVQGFATSHDAAGCCGFRIWMPDGTQMAIATDLGCMTRDVYSNLQGAALVALEANYDPEKLQRGPYPAYLKRRIDSSRGHLSNGDSAATVAQLISDGCRRVALCHLSLENNHPNLALDALDRALFEAGLLMPADCVVQVSQRYEPSPWMDF